MTAKEVTEMPKRIVPYGKESEKIGEFNMLYKNMVDAYKRLPYHCGQEAIPLNPREITAERFTNYVEKMMSGLNEEQKLVWKKLLSDALMNIKFISNFFEAFPSAQFDVDDSPSTPTEKRFTCNNKVEAVRSVSEIEVPEDCRKYFKKVQAFAKVLNEMRDYEKSHGLQHRPMDEMPYYSIHADEFTQKFIGGYFNKK